MEAELKAMRTLVRVAWRVSAHTRLDWLRYLGRIQVLDAIEIGMLGQTLAVQVMKEEG